MSAAIVNIGQSSNPWTLKYSGKGEHTEIMPSKWSEAIIIMTFSGSWSYCTDYCFKGMPSVRYEVSTVDNLQSNITGSSHILWYYNNDSNSITLQNAKYRGTEYISIDTQYIYYR